MLIHKKLIVALLVFFIFVNSSFAHNNDDCDEDGGNPKDNIKKNSGKNFYDINDYYSNENYNYYSGSNKDCASASYITVPLGTTGGLDEGGLSSFLLTKKGSNLFIALDAGTIWAGVRRLTTFKQFNSLFNIQYPDWAVLPEQKTSWFIKNHILGYFIGHSHIDHVGGLIIVSPEDYISAGYLTATPKINTGIVGLFNKMGLNTTNHNFTANLLTSKPIIGLPTTNKYIQEDLFNWFIWPNLPQLSRYSYYTVASGIENNVAESLIQFNASLTGAVANDFPFSHKFKTFDVCHDTLTSSAFLFTDKISGEQVAFFSDTGVPSSTGLTCDWEAKIINVFKSITLGKLKAIYLECSFLNEAADSTLFGHLRPKDVMKLMDYLLTQSVNSGYTNLKHVKLIIQHIKPQVTQATNNWTAQKAVYEQLKALNTHNVKIIIPNQGDPICI
ncbi:hypothetical protein DICPUDRAFT_91767 [Dictyostelium purpureum]|uniref:3',5'-cyclic-nucleotide phosphodiesterase n=1 Tax=Dictyostelium purpureum TaxID=5786 RepID=F0ZGY4_DICPU|nr:uncharacterized protein DICPUDRAFT_91767 [Dictyostelium purpureum]EGC36794.1 hypothetical protein DICPUDRAFT_91767 [Dictyostelium purpureum]|eukprot:XP_003286665.1 hypothetical protein DICPUDRAFT_91767 [Dictyostelium purpureum]